MTNTFLRSPVCFSVLISSGIGLLFPIGAIAFLLFYQQQAVSWLTIKQLHATEHLLPVIWTAPVVFAFFGYVLGKATSSIRQQMLIAENQKTALETIFDTVASAIVSINHKGIVTNFNKAAEQIFGYSASEVVGQNVKILMPDEVAVQHDQFLKSYLTNKKPKILGQQREIEALHKEGKTFSATLKVSELNLQGDIYFTAVIDDISQAKSLMAQLNQAQKMEAIGQLASGIAHEINTPVQYIGDNLHALQTNFEDLQAFIEKIKESLPQCSDEIKQQWHDWEQQFDVDFILQDTPLAISQSLEGVEQVTSIVKAMKVFSHANSESVSFTSVNEMLANTLTICRNEYKYIADIEPQFADNLPEIECYANELNQVFLNLIINAAHAIDEKKSGRGIIKITTELQQSLISISIKDNGAGIPKAIQDKVFNLFFTTKGVGKGSGQGLSIAHEIIVEKHHGKFYFDSVEGAGTTFYIQLPLTLEK